MIADQGGIDMTDGRTRHSRRTVLRNAGIAAAGGLVAASAGGRVVGRRIAVSD